MPLRRKSMLLGVMTMRIATVEAFSTLQHGMRKSHLHPRSLSEVRSRSPMMAFLSYTSEDHDEREQSLDYITMKNLELEQFQRRKETIQRKQVQESLHAPPNPLLTPKEVVVAILSGLQACNIVDEEGKVSVSSSLSSISQHKRSVLTLLEASTPSWRATLCQSIGAPADATNAQVAPILHDALCRPTDNQFAILLGTDPHHKIYQLQFPTDVLDYGDGTCWLESRLRNPKNGDLLAVLGWSLEQRSSDGAWLLDQMDWQDFRDEYRPGIGREEWERICG